MNYSPRSSSASAAETAALQARFGLRIAACLTESAEQVPHDIGERLRVAREQALARAQASRRATVAAKRPAPVRAVHLNGQGTATLGSGGGFGGGFGWLFKAASVLPVLVVALGVFLIDDLHERSQIAAAAEIDSALLADAVPPDAYRDPGFVEYLKSQQ